MLIIRKQKFWQYNLFKVTQLKHELDASVYKLSVYCTTLYYQTQEETKLQGL